MVSQVVVMPANKIDSQGYRGSKIPIYGACSLLITGKMLKFIVSY